MHPIRAGTPVLLLLLAAIAGPGSAQDIPADIRNITTDMEPSASDNGDQLIYVTNRSSHPIIVTSVRLMEVRERSRQLRLPADEKPGSARHSGDGPSGAAPGSGGGL